MRPLDYVFYHSPCTDGFTAAWVIWKCYGDAVEYVPLRYGDELPVDVTGKHILFVDVSLKREETLAAAYKARSILILDHHKTAEAELNDLGKDNVEVVFDMQKSGARLAWDFVRDQELERLGGHLPSYIKWMDDLFKPSYKFESGEVVPYMVALVEDRDLWRFAIPETRELGRYINSFPMEFASWDEAAQSLLLPEAKAAAKALDRAFNIEVQRLADLSVTGQTENRVKFPLGYATKIYSSDLAHELLKRNPDAPFAAVVCQEGYQQIWSLRSEDHRSDVSEIADWMGGGGHRNAAGFQMEGSGFDVLPCDLGQVAEALQREQETFQQKVMRAGPLLKDVEFAPTKDEKYTYQRHFPLPKIGE